MSRAEPTTVAVPWDLDADLLASPDLSRIPEFVRALRGNRLLPTPIHTLSMTGPLMKHGVRKRRPQALADLCQGAPNPRLVELLLGLPEGFSDRCRPLVVARRPAAVTRALRIVSACSGIGAALFGVVLAAHALRVAVDVVAAVEWWEAAARVHKARFLGTPIYGSVRSPWTRRKLQALDPVDLLVVTPPCTPHSRRKIHGPGGRDHAEFVEVLPLVDDVRPAAVLYETVEGILYEDARYLREVADGLRARGYFVRVRLVKASEFGAIHARARIILVAHRMGLAPAVFDAPTDPRPEELSQEEWFSRVLTEHDFAPVASTDERVRSSMVGGGVCVPVAVAGARAAIRSLLAPHAAEPAVDAGPKPRVFAGGPAQLHYGMDVLDGLRRVETGSVAMVATSPPYWKAHNVTYKHRDVWGKEATFGEHGDRLVAMAREVHRVLKPGGTFWLNYGDHTGDDGGLLLLPAKVAKRVKEAGFYLVNAATWVKLNPGPKRAAQKMLCPATEPVFVFARLGESPRLDLRATGKMPSPATVEGRVRNGWSQERAEGTPLPANDVFYSAVSHASGRGHPCAFPPSLVEQWIRLATTEGDVVLDPFSGSAATGMAALSLGRKYIGIDVQPAYLPLAERNLSRAATPVRKRGQTAA